MRPNRHAAVAPDSIVETSSVTAEPARLLRIALVAPLVTTISEPQQGGSQALLADLAVGLTRHGHDVDVYAATGSEIPGRTWSTRGSSRRA